MLGTIDSAFQSSSEADTLRQFMRQRDVSRRRDSSLLIYPFLTKAIPKDFVELISWEPGHVLIMQPVGKRLLLVASFYGNIAGIICMSSTPSHWLDKIAPSGQLYVIAPGLCRCVGPVSLADFFVMKSGDEEFADSSLASLFHALDTIEPYPPFCTAE